MKPKDMTTGRLLGIAVVLLGGLATVPAAAEDSEVTARKLAAKANRLAAKNKCKLAVPAFNRAYRTLKDPTLLFNRAECLRKLGEDHDALRDYQLFLAEMPEAPNRAAIEERIASLLAAAKAETASATALPEAAAEPSQPAAKTPAKTEEPGESSTVTAAKAAAAPAAETPAPTSQPPQPTTKAPAAPLRRAEKWKD